MDFGNLLSGVASGNPLQIAGGIGSFIGSIFGNSPAPGHELPDIEKIANANRLTMNQVSSVCGYRESQNKRETYDGVASKAASDNSFFLTILGEYNRAKPFAQIVPGNAEWQATQYTPGVQLGVGLPGTGAYASQTYQPGVMLGTPIVSQTGSATMSLGAVNSLTQQDIKNILAGAGNGALAGAQTAAMNTPEGQAATKAAMESYIKEYQLPIAAGVGGIIWLAVKAFSKK